jgi:hypothetical protein
MLHKLFTQRHIFALSVLLAILVLGTACGGTAPAAQPPAAASSVSALVTNYENALNARSILLLGIVRLEQGTGPALTKDQAAKLIPLWQASKSLVGSGTASQAEIDAVTNQMLAILTPEQVQAINAMHLTQSDMQAFNQSLGVSAPAGGMPPGGGQSLTPSERATRQAQNGRTGGNTVSMDYLIKLLTAKAGS